MSAKLPLLVAVNRTKIGGDINIYYNLGKAVTLGQIAVDAEGVGQWFPNTSCAGTDTCPVSGFVAVRCNKPLDSATAGAFVSVNGTTANICAGAPIGTSAEVVDVTSPVSSVAVTGGTPGDTFDVVCLPNPDNDVLICYDEGFDAALGATDKPIPRKMNPVDHYVPQRPDNKITMSELMVSNWKGLRRINGRDVTIVVKIVPGGAGIPTEIQYYTNVRLSTPQNFPGDANENAKVNGEGSFNLNLFFAAQ